MADQGLSQRAAQTSGLPVGWKTYSPFPFGGMNVQASAHAVPDNEFPWIENFVRLGDGNLRALYDKGAALYTAPADQTIVYFEFYTINTVDYCAVFLDDGSAIQVKIADLSTTTIGPAGTFYDSMTGYLPYARQWGSIYLLICNRNTENDYWVWDGALLYSAGSAGPQGVTILSSGFSYGSTPTVTAYGGAGSGMTFDTTVNEGGVVEIKITNPGSGYNPADVVQLQFSGGGSDNSAVLTANLTSGQVGGVSITAQGSGYSGTPTVNFSGGGGSGAAGTAIVDTNKVVGVTITNPGSGYTSAPTVSFMGGGGTGATANAVLAPQGVESVNVVNGGSGFTSVPLITFVGGGGAGATGFVKLAPTSVAAINVTSSGSLYSTAPSISFTGGGDGATLPTATVIMNGDGVGAVEITDGGSNITQAVEVVFKASGSLSSATGSGAGAKVVFAPTSIDSVVVSAHGQFYTDAPAVEVSPGANSSAYATVNLMPYGVSGSAMETFLSRVWIVNPATQQFSTTPPGNLYFFSAPGSVIDFATSDGGGSAVNTDSFLQKQYVGVRQSAGYLYFFGDGSVSVVSNVNTSGTPTTTTYSYQNVDPQAGLSFRDSIQDFGRATIIANETGIYGLYGGAVTNISGKITQLFNNAVYPTAGGLTPTSAISTIFNVKHYLNLLTLIDPDTNAQRNVMVAWNEKDWTIASQTGNIVRIGTRKIGSDYQAWGTDGKSMYPLFSTPSTSLAKRIDTKVYGADRMYMQKQAFQVYMSAQDRSTNKAGIRGTLLLQVSGLSDQVSGGSTLNSGLYESLVMQPAFNSPNPYWSLWGTSVEGVGFTMTAMRFTSSSPDFILGNLLLGYVDATALA